MDQSMELGSTGWRGETINVITSDRDSLDRFTHHFNVLQPRMESPLARYMIVEITNRLDAAYEANRYMLGAVSDNRYVFQEYVDGQDIDVILLSLRRPTLELIRNKMILTEFLFDFNDFYRLYGADFHHFKSLKPINPSTTLLIRNRNEMAKKNKKYLELKEYLEGNVEDSFDFRGRFARHFVLKKDV